MAVMVCWAAWIEDLNLDEIQPNSSKYGSEKMPWTVMALPIGRAVARVSALRVNRSQVA
jgi:hypothetical protein